MRDSHFVEPPAGSSFGASAHPATCGISLWKLRSGRGTRSGSGALGGKGLTAVTPVAKVFDPHDQDQVGAFRGRSHRSLRSDVRLIAFNKTTLPPGGVSGACERSNPIQQQHSWKKLGYGFGNVFWGAAEKSSQLGILQREDDQPPFFVADF